MAEVCLKKDHAPSLSKNVLDPAIVFCEQVLQAEKELFLLNWQTQFPDVEAPRLEFADRKEAQKYLSACNLLIDVLEQRVKQKKLYRCFLQTYLAKTKNGFQGKDNASIPRFPVIKIVTEQSNPEEAAVSKIEKNTDPDNCKLKVTLRTKKVSGIPEMASQITTTEKSAKRHSRVLENIKIFEANCDFKELDLTQKQAKKQFPGKESPNKIQTSNAASKSEKNQTPDRSASSSPKTQQSATATDMSTGREYSTKKNRNNYEEVWACNTGEKKSFIVDNKNEPEKQTNMLIKDYIEELENHQELATNDIDLAQDQKKKSNLAGSEAKIKDKFSNKKSSRGRTTAVVIPSFQDPEVVGNMATQSCRLSSGGGSDVEDDVLSDSQSRSSEEAEIKEFPLKQRSSRSNLTEFSPLLRLRKAQTTNERMSVAFSYPDWSDADDETSSSHNRSPLLSCSDEFPPPPDTPSWEEEGSIKSNTTVTDLNSTTNEDGSVLSSLSDKLDKNITPENLPSPAAMKVGSPSSKEVLHMVDYHKVRNLADAEKLNMRRFVLNSLLDTEETYLKYLDTLLLYMKPLKATISTSQPVMSSQDFETVFHCVPELHELHSNFYQSLKPRLDSWTPDANVGDLFKKLLGKLKYYGDYFNNYKRAQHTVEKCAKENSQFAQITESLKVKSDNQKDLDSISLIMALYKPMERLVRMTLVLRDLLKHTPHTHPDFPVLREVLKQTQIFLDRLNSASSSSFRPRRVATSAVAAARSADRELIKHGFLVEVASDGRKLRHCFLFSDLLLCAKSKSTAGVFHNKTTYECKWYIPLADLSFQAREDSEVSPDIQLTNEDELRELSNHAQQLKYNISREHKRNVKEQKSSDGAQAKNRKEERLKKKLAEVEAKMVLASPDLPLRMYNTEGKCYTFLMSSDYERTEWTDAILKQQESCFKSFSLTSLEISLLLATCAKQRKMNNIESMLSREDEELLSGYLSVTVKSGHGFLTTCNPYCSLEVDSFGQFQTKARTRVCKNTKCPDWNEEFELDVDGAMTLRLLCYDRDRDAPAGSSIDKDVLIAKGKFGLVKKSLWEKGEWTEERMIMNDLTINISVKFSARENSIQRLPSQKSNGVFGVDIQTVAARDSSGIPTVVRKCVAEVERRGMEEIGIYRVSGVASDIKSLKDAFDTDRNDVNMALAEVDINAVAGLLKLYFRELPEPLFTDAQYKNFIEASSLADPETKQRTITRLLSDLPIINYNTLRFLRQHLVNVANKESINKMTFHNLATVFGPTLLRPAEDSKASDQNLAHATMMLNALRLDVHSQMDILMFCLQLNEFPDYDSLKKSLTRDEASNRSGVSHCVPDLSRKYQEPIPQQDATQSQEINVPASPLLNRTSPNAFSHSRVHHYEEIELPLKRNPNSQSLKPSGSGNKVQFRPLKLQNPPNSRQTVNDFSTEL